MTNVIEFKAPPKVETVPTWEELQKSFGEVQQTVISDLRAKIKRERLEANCCMAIMGIVIVALLIMLG